MNNEKKVRFRQSYTDFPLTVELGAKEPAWGLYRWRGDRGLSFKPPDDEGFSIRGDGKRLVYKGRRRSHRFTILGDGAFEYDCILNREPGSNVISLRMEGAENYDFFRQPDFVPDPFLKGSYAVYKKDTLVGEGTGKLCHINRPEIIDARGRRVWGDLSIDGDCLCISIPETWLSEAAYPVVVDPIIGTNTIGSQYMWKPSPSDPNQRIMLDSLIAVNRFYVPESSRGSCNCFAYTAYDDKDAGGRGLIYSDVNNKPDTKRTLNQVFINFRVGGSNPAAGWRSGNSMYISDMVAGTYIWFGITTEYIWYPRFDYGSTCYFGYYSGTNNTPSAFPTTRATFDLKLSMYFSYTAPSNFTRTLTQGVGIATSLERKQELNRKCEEAAAAEGETAQKLGIFRRFEEALAGTDGLSTPIYLRRSISETQGISDTIRQCMAYFRGLYSEAICIEETSRQGGFFRIHGDTVQAAGSMFRRMFIFVHLLTVSTVRDFILSRFLKAKEELVLKSCITREIFLESKIA